MLVVVSFPIIDSRAFVEEDTYSLKYPVWPSPEPFHDFVRYFGEIRRRPRGGMNNWVSESVICEARKAVRLDNSSSTNIQLAFRRFYFDGLAVGKFEIGFKVAFDEEEDHDTENQLPLEGLLRNILNIDTHIPNPEGNMVSCPLHEAGKHIANLYLRATTNLSEKGNVPLNNWWVQSRTPILCIEEKDISNVTLPRQRKSMTFEKYPDLGISHFLFEKYRVWYIGQNQINRQSKWRALHYFSSKRSAKSPIHKPVRDLRVHLLRLHTEKEALKQVLSNLAQGKIGPCPRSEESDRLQLYLNTATRKVLRFEVKSQNILGEDILGIVQSAEQSVSSGEASAIIQTLERLQIRGNVAQKIKDFTRPELIKIRDLISQYFSLEEIKELSFELGIDYENFSENGKTSLVRELLIYCERSNRLVELIKKAEEKRPGLAWPIVTD